MKQIKVLTIIFLLFTYFSKSESYLPARIINPEAGHAISETKIDMALSFAFALLDKKYVSAKERDSVSAQLYEINENPELMRVANLTNSENLLFVKVNVLENIIRADIDIINVADTTKRSRGYGYALVRYFDNETGDLVYDPALLTSIQRALAVAMNDSLLFVDSTKGFNVRPLPTMVIGSLYYVDYDSFKDWEIIRNHVVSSYSAVESIFEAANKSEKYIVYDLATRDSVYAKFKLYGIENYAAPSEQEFDALYQVGIDYFITGSLERNDEGAKIMMSLFALRHRGLLLIEQVEGILKNDDLTELQVLVRKLTRELID
ncbi:MAG: hypothetical protein CVV22_04520 [Ignavibacteriae bacterium HGW-Ignavibacteriae-1]|jgi:hypothetical protein|nr:MAG: hypothetical protein CVV22_04520 [Ignavibacteriae bacterium HGW-Ignavibacteriae-1]